MKQSASVHSLTRREMLTGIASAFALFALAGCSNGETLQIHIQVKI